MYGKINMYLLNCAYSDGEKMVDYTNLVEQFTSMTCVLSVDVGPDKTYGNILIVSGNKALKDDILNRTQKPFVDNTPYYYSLPQNSNFEYFIYRCAVLHEPLHSYVSLYQMGLWLEMFLLPLNSEIDGKGYCLYSFVVSPTANESRMSDLAPDTAQSVLKSCIKLRGAEDFTKTITEVADDIRSICGAYRCSIVEIDTENETCTVLGNSRLSNLNSFLDNEPGRRDFYKLVKTWEDTLAGSTCLVAKNEQDMMLIKEINPEWYKSLSDHGVDTLVLFPLKFNGKLLGYIWVTNFDVDNTIWIKEVLELTTFFIGSEIANYQMLKKLEKLSTIDILTGTLNRNAMNNRIDSLTADIGDIKTLGIIFTDLNGLKMVNDKCGHLEGDRYIKKAVAQLRMIFIDDEIYRAGGDEFMILVPNNTRAEFDEKIRALEKAQGQVNFAIGTCFQEGNIDVTTALRDADKKMYRNKEDYYTEHPELKYR